MSTRLIGVRAITVVAGTVLLIGCGPASMSPAGEPSASSVVASSPRPTTSPIASRPATPTATARPTGAPAIEAAGAIRAAVAGDPDWLIVIDGQPFTAAGGGVMPLDATTGVPEKVIPLQGGVCSAFDAGYGRLWAETCETHTLWAIDPARRKVIDSVVLPVTEVQWEGSVGAGSGGVWLASTDRELIKVDQRSMKVLGRWPLPYDLAAVRAGLGAVWVAAPGLGRLLRVDPNDPTSMDEIRVGQGPRFLAVGDEAVWVMNQGDGSVTRVDRDGRVVATIDVSRVPIQGGDIAVGGGFVWIRTEQDLVVVIDPATNQVVARYGPPSGSGSVAADDSAAWISAHDVSAVWRLPLPMATGG